MVHGLDDRCDPGKTVHREMAALLHQSNHRRELSKLIELRGSQRVIFEERNDALAEVCQSPDDISVHVFPMVVAAAIDRHASASEERLQIREDLRAPSSLHDNELRLNLPTESRLRVPERSEH